MFSTSLQFPKLDGPKTITRNDAANVTFRDFGGSNRLSLILIDQTAPDQSMRKLPIAYFAR
jgi:hypothetical protein